MPALLANSPFQAKPDESKVAVDVYGTPPILPTNNIPGLPAEPSLGSVFKGNTFLATLKNVAKDYGKSGVFDKGKTLDRLAKSIGVNDYTMLLKFNSQTTDRMLEGMGFYNTEFAKVADSHFKTFTGKGLKESVSMGSQAWRISKGDIVKNLKADFGSVESLSSFIEMMQIAVGGDVEFASMYGIGDALNAFVGLNTIAREWGIPGVMDQLLDKVDDRDKKRVVIDSVARQGTATDIDYMNKLTEHANPAELLASNPNLIKDILSSFEPSMKYPDVSDEARDVLLSTLKKIDPRWMYSKDQSLKHDTFDLPTFAVTSIFAEAVFTRYELFVSPRLLSRTVNTPPFEELSKKFYPY